MHQAQPHEKLVIEIKYVHPLELNDLAECLLATSAEFQRHLSLNESAAAAEEVKLLVSEVRKGSVVLEFVAACQGMLPEVVQHGRTLLSFLTDFKKTVKYLLKEEDQPRPQGLDKPRLERIQKFVQPVARDIQGSQVVMYVEKGGITCETLNLGMMEANTVQNSAQQEINKLREQVAGYHDQTILYFFQTRDDKRSDTGDKAVIERFGRSAVRTRFATEEAKAKVLGLSGNIFHHAFIVDVKVDTIEGRPVLYTVIRVHEVIPRAKQDELPVLSNPAGLG